MSELFETFRQRVTIADGAWGTLLQRQGLPAGTPPDTWNLDNPAAVEAVARSYVQAGSQVILTNSFRSNRLALEREGLADQAGALAEAAAEISRRAAGSDVKVFGSMGPTGRIVMMGEVSKEAIYESFAIQARGLTAGGADAILCETFSELAEAMLAARAARDATALPVIVSMTFDAGPDRTATMMGTTPADLAAAGAAVPLAGVGANCGAGPEHYVALTRLFRAATDLPLWIKPNAGLPIVRNGQTVFPMGPEAFAAFAPRLVEAGANFIGGCCGTTPEHIRAVATVLSG